jgi:hypothetical protein
MKLSTTMIALTLVLVILRICGVVDWPWFYVFCPILIPAALLLAVSLSFLVSFLFIWTGISLVETYRETRAQKRRRKHGCRATGSECGCN